MRSLKARYIYMQGDLYDRAILNFDRLEEENYQPQHVFQKDAYDWPGDYEGRTILALTLLAQYTHRKPKYLEEIMRRLPQRFNERGYMGTVYEPGVFDEQQLSSHSWLLRGLIEYYMWQQDEAVYRYITQMIEQLVLPLRGYVKGYPTKAEERSNDGAESGSLQGRVRNWLLSSDIGCLFIMLDGASQAYELTRDARLKRLIEEMLEHFFTIPLVDISAQTHATLSALRGALRFSLTTGEWKYLDAIKRTYQLYVRHGMTENYANYNWFRKPSWTEPCAIIDSYIVAFQLWMVTGNTSYLEDAQHIYYNAICFAQRYNGGFGCDTCAGAGTVYFGVRDKAFEAHWCCTMRGGEGLSRAIEFAYMLDGEQLYVTGYHNSVARIGYADGNVVLRQSTTFPYRGDVRLEVVEASLHETKKRTLHLFVPSWCNFRQLQVNGEILSTQPHNNWLTVELELTEGTIVEMVTEPSLLYVPARNSHSIISAGTYRHGCLILVDKQTNKAADVVQMIGVGEGLAKEKQLKPLLNGTYRSAAGQVLEPLYYPVLTVNHTQHEWDKLQIMF